ncbi:MAG: hypothetical protein ACR2NN_03825 [Bryobacteraceae bacterium]
MEQDCREWSETNPDDLKSNEVGDVFHWPCTFKFSTIDCDKTELFGESAHNSFGVYIVGT